MATAYLEPWADALGGADRRRAGPRARRRRRPGVVQHGGPLPAGRRSGQRRVEAPRRGEPRALRRRSRRHRDRLGHQRRPRPHLGGAPPPGDLRPRSWAPVGPTGDPEAWQQVDRPSTTTRFGRYAAPAASISPSSWPTAPRADLDPDALIIGFARRFATYKRATLLLQHPGRARRAAGRRRPSGAVRLRRQGPPGRRAGQGAAGRDRRVRRDRRRRTAGSCSLPDYDMAVAQAMYAGCDVWLNNPVRPHEASGTSGEKSALNGGLNCSISDGWWDEMADGRNGWTIPEQPGRPTRADATARSRRPRSTLLADADRARVLRPDGGPGRRPGSNGSGTTGAASAPGSPPPVWCATTATSSTGPPSSTDAGGRVTHLARGHVPAGRHLADGVGRELRGLLRGRPSTSSCASSTTTAPRRRDRAARGHGLGPPRLPPRRRPGQRYGFRVHGPWNPAGGLRSATRPSCCSTPTPRRSPGRSRWGAEVYGHVPGDLLVRDDRDSAPLMPKAVVIDPPSTGATTPRPAIPSARDGHLRDPRPGHDHDPPRRAAGAARHLRGAGQPTDPRAPRSDSGVTAVELLPVHHFVSEHTVVRARAAPTTGATTRSPSSPRTVPTRRSATPAGRSSSSRRWSRRSTPPASR